MDRAPEVDSDTLSAGEIAELLAAAREPRPAPSVAPVDAPRPPEPGGETSAAGARPPTPDPDEPSAPEAAAPDEALSAAEIAAMLAGEAPKDPEAAAPDEALSAAEIAAMLAAESRSAPEAAPPDEALSAAEIAAMLAGAAAPSPEVTQTTQTIELDAVAAEEPVVRSPKPPRPPPRSLPPVVRASLPPSLPPLPPLATLALQPLSSPPQARRTSAGPAAGGPSTPPTPSGASRARGTAGAASAAALVSAASPTSTPPHASVAEAAPAPLPEAPARPSAAPARVMAAPVPAPVVAAPAPVAAAPGPPSPPPDLASVTELAVPPRVVPPAPPAGSMDLEALISATPHDLSRKLYRSDAIGRIVATLRMLGREASGRPEGDRKFIAALLRAVTNDGLELPVMPKLVLDIQRVLDSPTADLGGVIGSIEQEPMVSTKVVGIASSAAYRAVAPPRSVREAVFRIGMAETRNVVLAILSQSKLFRVPGHEKRALELSRRAIGAAAAASRIARAIRVDVDQAFLAGMTHDIGSVALLNVAAELHRSSRGKVVVTPRMLTEVEHAVHADLSALVAETWSFPAPVVAAFACHHAPTEAPPEALRLAQLLALSDAIVLHLVDGRNHGIPTEHPAAVALGFRELRDLVGDVRRSFDSLCSAAAPASTAGLRAGRAR